MHGFHWQTVCYILCTGLRERVKEANVVQSQGLPFVGREDSHYAFNGTVSFGVTPNTVRDVGSDAKDGREAAVIRRQKKVTQAARGNWWDLV